MFKFKNGHCNEDPAATHALETIADLLGIPRKEFVKAVNVPPELLEVVLTSERNEDNMEMKKPKKDHSVYSTADEIHVKYDNIIIEELLKLYTDNWYEPHVITLNHNIWPECWYRDKITGEIIGGKDEKKYSNDDMLPSVPSNILLLLKYLNFFSNDADYLKITPMLYFYLR